MKSLADRNANPTRRARGEYTLESTYAVGGMGRSWSATHSGAKFHLIHVDTVVERDEAKVAELKALYPKRTFMRVGQVFSSVALCNGSGQSTGIIHSGSDTDRINCKSCLKAMGA